MSELIRRLELELGAQLFIRTTKSRPHAASGSRPASDTDHTLPGVAARMADYLLGHHAPLPGAGEPEQTGFAARRLADRRHGWGCSWPTVAERHHRRAGASGGSGEQAGQVPTIGKCVKRASYPNLCLTCSRTRSSSWGGIARTAPQRSQ
jgi:hypothetical protein